MSKDLAFACQCGAVDGTIRDAVPAVGDRVVCHCDNCQQFACFCGAEDRVLDAHRGTDLYQARFARVEIQRGSGNLACVHLTEKPTLRWYTTCCRSPMFNTFANGRLPYITAHLANCPAGECNELLGAPKAHFFLKDAPEEAHQLPAGSIAYFVLRWAVRSVKDTLSGDRRRSALFDGDTLAPIARPHRLNEAERRKLADQTKTGWA